MSITSLKSLVICSVFLALMLFLLIALGQVNILSIPCVCAISYALYTQLS